MHAFMHAQAADNAVGITILGEYHGLIGVPVSQNSILLITLMSRAVVYIL